MDGYQNEFATSHLGHALLVKLLLPLPKSTAAQPGSDVRIFKMTSIAYKQALSNGIDFATLQTSQEKLGNRIVGPRWARYGESKLKQLMYTREVARHHPDITSVAIHPGYIMTGLFDDLPFMTGKAVMVMSLGKKTKIEEGHYHQVMAATCDKKWLKNGA